MNFLLALSLLLCVAYTLAAPKCCTPAQWEGTVHAYRRRKDQSSGKVEIDKESWKVAYDTTNKRFAEVITHKLPGAKEYTERRVLLQEDDGIVKEYRINENGNGGCSIKSDAYVELDCVPETATGGEKYSLGLASDDLEVTSWVYQYEWEGINYVDVMEVRDISEGVCVPVTEESKGFEGPYSFVGGATYSGITLGIADESVFDVPAECMKNKFNRGLFWGSYTAGKTRKFRFAP